MTTQPRRDQGYLIYIAAAITAGLAYAFLYPSLPYITDWAVIFSRLPAHWANPYAISKFANPPYIILFLPHALLPLQISSAINAALNIACLAIANHKYKGGLIGLVLIFTSVYFMELIANDNIDWLPLLGVLSPPALGLVLLSLKPQTLAGIGLIWVKRHGIKIAIPAAIVLLASLVVWWGWPLAWLRTSHEFMPSGITLFPFLIPVGFYALYKAWITDDEVLSAAATACFVPYFGAYSLAPVLAILGKKYRWLAILLWCSGWAFIFFRIAIPN